MESPSCRISIPILFLLTLLSTGIIQGMVDGIHSIYIYIQNLIPLVAILITRVWFLYPGATILRFIVVFTFVVTKSIALAFLYTSANQLEFIYVTGSGSEDVVGCRVSRPPGFWRIYVPSLVLHASRFPE